MLLWHPYRFFFSSPESPVGWKNAVRCVDSIHSHPSSIQWSENMLRRKTVACLSWRRKSAHSFSIICARAKPKWNACRIDACAVSGLPEIGHRLGRDGDAHLGRAIFSVGHARLRSNKNWHTLHSCESRPAARDRTASHV